MAWFPHSGLVLSCWPRAEVGCYEKNLRQLLCALSPRTSTLCVSVTAVAGVERHARGPGRVLAGGHRHADPRPDALDRAACAIACARCLTQDFADVTTGESRRAAGDEWDGGGSAFHGEEGLQPEEPNKILYTAAAHRVAVGQKKGETITYV